MSYSFFEKYFEQYTPPVFIDRTHTKEYLEKRQVFLGRLTDLKQRAHGVFCDVDMSLMQLITHKHWRMKECEEEMRELGRVQPPVAQWVFLLNEGEIGHEVQSPNLVLKEKMRAYKQFEKEKEEYVRNVMRGVREGGWLLNELACHMPDEFREVMKLCRNFVSD